MRTDTVYKKAFNRTATMLRDGQLVGELPSENELRRRMCVSRTTVRKVLRELVRPQLITQRSGIRAAGRAVDTTATIRRRNRRAPSMSNSNSWSGCCGVTPGPEQASTAQQRGGSVLRPAEFASSDRFIDLG